MTVNTTQITQLVPDEGKHLKNIKTGQVFARGIYIPKSFTADDFTEITEQEYQAIKADLKEIEESEEWIWAKIMLRKLLR